jgi:hypothetical protein
MGCVLSPGSHDNIWRTLLRIINKKNVKNGLCRSVVVENG